MRGSLVIAGRDLRSSFETPMAYIVIAAFVTVASLIFAYFLFSFSDLSDAIRAAAAGDPTIAQRVSVDAAVVEPLLRFLAMLLIGLVPLLTMRAIAEERRQGTMELLLTAPVEPIAIVIGKFLGALGLVAAALAMTASLPLLLITVATPDPGPLLTGYLGLVLVAAAFTSLGLLASSLTESSVTAAFLGFALVVASVLLGMVGNALETNIGTVLSWMSVLVHFDQLAAGVIDTSDLAFFALFIGFNLFMTLRVIDSHRWR
jgi:ABC-2 type transport system permease protein